MDPQTVRVLSVLSMFLNLGARHGHTMNAKIDRLKASEEEGLKRLLEVRKQQEARKKKENLDQWEDKIYGSTGLKTILDAFQFRWLNISGIDTAISISIRLFSNHLN